MPSMGCTCRFSQKHTGSSASHSDEWLSAGCTVPTVAAVDLLLLLWPVVSVAVTAVPLDAAIAVLVMLWLLLLVPVRLPRIPAPPPFGGYTRQLSSSVAGLIEADDER